MVEVLDFILWCAQEAGVLISVSAAVAVAVGYLTAMRDGVVTEKEARFSKNSRRVLDLGLALIILSGLAIVAFHFSEAQSAVVYSPVFLFKWLLILALTCVYIAQRGKPYAHFLVEGVTAGSWVALFAVHVIAPSFSWIVLFAIYAGIVGVFLAAWSTVVKMMQKPAAKPAMPAQKQMPVAAVVQAPRPIAPPVVQPVVKAVVPAPAPVVAAPVVAPKPFATPVVAPPPAPAPVVVSKPLPPPAPPPPAPMVVSKPVAAPVPPPLFDAHDSPWLPALHVMPKDMAQLQDKSHITTLGALKKSA